MKTRTVGATEFKAKCLAILDEIVESRESVTITKRGVPVAVLGPVPKRAWKSPKDSWAGRLEIVGDIVNADDSDLWNCLKDDDPGDPGE